MKRFPSVKQRDIKDCGPACILSILEYYNGYVPLEIIRSDCYTNVNGTTAYHMVNALKKYGFDAYGAETKKNNFNFKELVLPCIAHMRLKNGLEHYVVIYKITKSYILIMDPAHGIEKRKFEDFKREFNNIVIVCYLNSNYIVKMEKISLFEFVISLIVNDKKQFIKLLTFGIFSVIFTIISSFYFKVLFNNIDDRSVLKILMITFFFCYLSKSFFEYLSSYLKNYIIKNIDYNMNKEFFSKLFFLPSRIVKNRNIGEIITRVTELNNLHEIVSDVVVNLFINIALAILSFIVLYFINSKLLIIFIIFAVIFIIIGIFTNKIIYKMIKKSIESNESFNSDVIENCNAFDTVKNTGLENFVIEKLDNSLINYLKNNFDITKSINIINFIRSLAIDLMYFTIISVGIILLLNHKLSLINFITFEMILVYLIDPIKNILNMFPKINYLKASLEKILEFMNLKSEELDKNNNFLVGDLVVKNLDYSYNDYTKILSNINLVIKQNEKVMIRGQSGIGKSTFCKLLNRTYDYSKGTITIGGINIKDYPLKTLRKNVLYLSQNEFLFNDTIRNNIILNKKYDINKFNSIAKICFLEEIIKKKPLRYETFIDKNFTNLSGGEKQRIILARALYQNAKIIILDESLSEVNIDLERKIINNLKLFLSDKILIYVTHKRHDDLFDNILTIGDNDEKI